MSDDQKPNFTLIKKKSWRPVIAGVLAFFLFAAVGAWWWTHHADQTEIAPAPVAQAEPEPAVSAVDEPTPEPITMAADPAATTTENVAPPAPVTEHEREPPATADPTNCTFVDGNRPKVGEKYILRCDDRMYLAVGTYNGENFDWSKFEGYKP